MLAFHDTANDPERSKYVADYFRATHIVKANSILALEVPADWTPPFNFSEWGYAGLSNLG